MLARRLALLALLACAAPGAVATARPLWVGTYRVAEGPDTAGALELRPDGRFRYALAEGALDEQADGTWVAAPDGVRLTTEPKPTPAAFARAADDAATQAPTLIVRLPGTQDSLAGVDFRLGLDDGSVLAGYTQYYGWSFAAGDAQAIRWVELHEPIHGVASPRFAIEPPARGGLSFVLTPNDIGVVDFAGALLARDGDGYLLRHPARDLRLIKARP